MGYGIVKGENKTPRLITLGVIELGKFKDHYVRIRKVFERTLELIDSLWAKK